VYFASGRDNCVAHDRDLSAFSTDASDNELPNVGFLVPDLDHDAHHASLAATHYSLTRFIAQILGAKP
jgi:acid phosphatase